MIALGLAAWLALALAVGASGVLRGLPFPVPQAVVTVLTAAAIAAWRGVPRVRAALDGVDLRALVALHLARYVGIAFLVLQSRGQLPAEFAVPAGWGDIAVASGALLLLTLVPPRGRGAWAGYAAWNVVGLLDLVAAVLLAFRALRQGPALMAPMTELPLSLVPTFLVPLAVVTHLAMLVRLARAREDGFGEI